MSNQKIIKAIAGIAAAGMMATCLPVAAFAATGDTYHFSFSNGSSQDLAPGGSMTFPASQYDYGYWITLQGHGGYTYNYYPGDTLPYDAVDQWFTADGITSCYAAEGNPRSITINYQIDGNTVLTETDTATFPGNVDGQSVEAWTTDSGDTYTASSKSLNHDRLFYYLGDDIHDNVLTLKATSASTPDDGKDDNKGNDKGDVTNPDDKGDNKGDNTGDSGTTTPDDKGDVVTTTPVRTTLLPAPTRATVLPPLLRPLLARTLKSLSTVKLPPLLPMAPGAMSTPSAPAVAITTGPARVTFTSVTIVVTKS